MERIDIPATVEVNTEQVDELLAKLSALSGKLKEVNSLLKEMAPDKEISLKVNIEL